MYRAMLLLLGAFALLWVIGTVNVFSATFAEDRLSGSAYGHLLRQLVFSAVGLIPAVMVFVVTITGCRNILNSCTL